MFSRKRLKNRHAVPQRTCLGPGVHLERPGTAPLELARRPRDFADLAKDPVIELTEIGTDLSGKTGIPLETTHPPES